jgi:competence protein ComEA
MADGYDSLAGRVPAPAAPQVNDSSIGSRGVGSASRAKASPDAIKVDVNRADAAALTRVKGIGAKTAQAIIEHRRAHGAYRNLRDLLQVKGIGEKKLEKLAPYLIL